MPKAKKTAKRATKKVSKKTTKQTTKRAAKKAVSKKPATSKKVVKKTQTAKSAVKNSNGKVLVCAEGKKCFWTNDGSILRDLQELSAALDVMEEKVFTHHVTKEKNDFADWVEHVLEDAECAAALRRSRKPSSASTVVVKHLKTYYL